MLDYCKIWRMSVKCTRVYKETYLIWLRDKISEIGNTKYSLCITGYYSFLHFNWILKAALSSVKLLADIIITTQLVFAVLRERYLKWCNQNRDISNDIITPTPMAASSRHPWVILYLYVYVSVFFSRWKWLYSLRNLTPLQHTVYVIGINVQDHYRCYVPKVDSAIRCGLHLKEI